MESEDIIERLTTDDDIEFEFDADRVRVVQRTGCSYASGLLMGWPVDKKKAKVGTYLP